MPLTYGMPQLNPQLKLPGFATGKTAWDPKGLFGSNPTPGMQANPQPQYKMSMGAGPQATYQADPQLTNTGVAESMPNPWAMSPTYTDKPAGNMDVSTPMPSGGLTGGSQQAPGLQTQYATWDNIQPYMNPYLDRIIANGTNAIEHSAAGRGLFGSSGNVNDIGDWAARATDKAYADAFDRFGADRGYMGDQYWKNRTANTNDYWNSYNANWDQYKYGDASYRGLLSDYYGQNNNLLEMQQNGADKTGAILAALGQSLAGLYGDQGNAAAAGGIAGAGANRGMVGNLLGLLALL